MNDTTPDFMRLLRPMSARPPAAWVKSDPAWFDGKEGRGIRIDTDPSSSEAGRAIGYVSPPGGERCYMKAQGQCLPTPTGSPDGFRTFHAEMLPFQTADGETVEIGIGSVPLGGGHSNPLLASTPETSAEFLQRKERWHRLADDIALYGSISETPAGLLFRGWVASNVTVAEADLLNNTVMSGEWIPDPELGGQPVFSGITRVGRTALPMRPLPMAASLDDCGCDLSSVVLQTFAMADLAEFGDPDMGDVVLSDAVPVRASSPEFEAEVRSALVDLGARLEEVESQVAALGALAVEDAAASTAGPGETLEDVVALVRKLGNELSAMRESVAAQGEQNRMALDNAAREATTSDGNAVSAPATTARAMS